MASLDTKDFDLILEFERDFARTLSLTLTHIFDASSEVAGAYIESLATAPLFERLLALHESPIEVAATLTGTPITDEMNSRYEDLLVRQDSPRLRSWDDRYPMPIRPVTKETIEAVLRLFGYDKVESREDGWVLWRSTDLEDVERHIARRVSIPSPQLHTSTGERVYDLYFVLDLISYLSSGRVSPEGAILILKALSR